MHQGSTGPRAHVSQTSPTAAPLASPAVSRLLVLPSAHNVAPLGVWGTVYTLGARLRVICVTRSALSALMSLLWLKIPLSTLAVRTSGAVVDLWSRCLPVFCGLGVSWCRCAFVVWVSPGAVLTAVAARHTVWRHLGRGILYTPGAKCASAWGLCGTKPCRVMTLSGWCTDCPAVGGLAAGHTQFIWRQKHLSQSHRSWVFFGGVGHCTRTEVHPWGVLSMQMICLGPPRVFVACGT